MATRARKNKSYGEDSDDGETLAQHMLKKTKRTSIVVPGISERPTVQKLIFYENAKWFSNMEQVKRFELYFDQCSVIQPWFVDEYDFEFDEGNLPPMRILRSLGLMEFCYMKGEYYEDLVKVFYCNLEWDAVHEVVTSEVKGIKITMNMKEWDNLTGLPSEGAYFLDAENVFEGEYNKTTAKAEMLLTDYEDYKYPSPALLKFEHRLLHLILIKCITPRANNFYRILDSDFLSLWVMINSKRINWSRCVLLHMLKFESKVRKRTEKELGKKTSMLPYALLITKILKHFNVPLSGETMKKTTTNTCINGNFVAQKGWKYHGEEIGWLPSFKDKVKVEDVTTPMNSNPYEQNDVPYSLRLFMEEVRCHMIRANAHQVAIEETLAKLNQKMDNIANSIEDVKQDQLAWKEAQGYFNEDFA